MLIAELQTIDDLQELAAVLQTTATSTFPTSSSAAVYSTPSMMNTPAFAGVGVQGNSIYWYIWDQYIDKSGSEILASQ